MNLKFPLISFLCTASLLGGLTSKCVSGGLDKDEVWDFPLPKPIVSLIVDELPVKDALELACVSKGMHSAVEGSEAWKFFKMNGVRPEPTISLRQAMRAKLLHIDAKIASYQRENTKRLCDKEERAREAKLGKAIKARAAEDIKLAEKLEKEASGHEQRMALYQKDWTQFNDEGLRCLNLACDLGDSALIASQYKRRRNHDASQNPPGNSAFEFLEPLCQKGYVKARQLKRDALSSVDTEQSYEAARQLNQQLMDEGYLEPYRFGNQHRYFICVGDEGERQKIKTNLLTLKDEETIHALMARAPNPTEVQKYLYMLPLNLKTCRFVVQELKDLPSICFDIACRIEKGYPVNTSLLERYTGLSDVFQDWLDQHGGQFEPFVIKQELGEEGEKLQAEFEAFCAGGKFSEAEELFYINRDKFTKVEQFAYLFAAMPNDESVDALRVKIAERMKRLKPSWRELDGVYSFLVKRGRVIMPLISTKPNPEKILTYDLMAMKFARLMGYVPEDMK